MFSAKFVRFNEVRQLGVNCIDTNNNITNNNDLTKTTLIGDCSINGPLNISKAMIRYQKNFNR